MDVRKSGRHWIGVALFVSLLAAQGRAALGQEGVELPPIGSVPTQSRTLSPPGVLPAAPPATSQFAPQIPPTILDDPPTDGYSAAGSAAGTPTASPSSGTGSSKDSGTDGKCPDPFAKVPPVAVLPRTGWFPILPTGPGYYTICNQCKDNKLSGPPKYPYPRFSLMFNSFFDVDWRYLDNPKNTEHDCFDWMKRVRFGPDDLFMWTSGGEFRARFAHEENSRLANPTMGRPDTYDLYRVRVYNDLYITPYFRIYTELLSATTPDHQLPPIPADRDPIDFLNLFADARTLTLADNPLWVRVGRQELLYGSQRLISPLDWANTRRTFQGVKAFWHSQNLDVDAFVVNPVVPPLLAAGGSANGFTSPDTQRTFAGWWNTYKFKPGTCIDLYYLMLDNDRSLFRAPTGAPGEQTTNTIGTRFVGDSNNWLWDFEGMAQFGRFAAQSQSAWAGVAGAGYYFKNVTMTPTVWLYYDYSSGSDQLATSPAAPGIAGPQGPHTFNQLFPFNHYYNWLDLVGRQNIQQFSSYYTFYPATWLTTQVRTQTFFLDSSKDFLYNSGGVGIRRDASGNSGKSVGTEFDCIVNFHIDNHQDLLFSYSYLVAGRFLRNTATSAAGRQNPQAVYVQYSFRW